MATYPGSVPVGGYIAPTDTSDTFAVTDSRFARGGHHEVADSTERDTIPTDRRRDGMTCYTQDDRKTWQLQGGILNGDWVDISGHGAGSGDLSYIYQQSSPSPIWLITHNLNKYPSVVIYDHTNIIIVGDITYNTPNRLTVTFTTPFSGQAFLN